MSKVKNNNQEMKKKESGFSLRELIGEKVATELYGSTKKKKS